MQNKSLGHSGGTPPLFLRSSDPFPSPCVEPFRDETPIKPEYLHNPDLRLLIFGGKGGVGKTTLSAAAAISMAKSRPLAKILILSTDPAHSLSDSLGIEVSDEMTPVPLEGSPGPVNLYARQLSASTLAARFKEKNGEIIKTIVGRGTYFDGEDIARFFDLSLPGIDEVMAILSVEALLADKVCDVLVLDTAPTGHTLRFMALPDHMRRWLHVMDLMLHKHRYMAAAFTRRRYIKDRCDHFLGDLDREITAVGALLKNPHLTRFIPVMNPEMMSFCETKALVARLEETRIPLREIIVNRINRGGECLFCRSEAWHQLEMMGRIKTHFSRYELILVEKNDREIKGVGPLSALAARVSNHTHVGRRFYESSSSLGDDGLDSLACDTPPVGDKGFRPLLHAPCLETCHGSGLSQMLTRGVASGLGLIMVGGKGGVGKTTLAAAVAVHLADSFKEKKILLFSADPAHSLSDVFSTPIGDRITPLSVNLSAYELDAERVFETFKKGCQEEIHALFNRFVGPGMDVAFDREVMMELLSLAPSGLDEIMALDAVMAIKEEGVYDVLVVDASPTGHLLRFLEMPALVRQWMKAYFTVLMKYKGSVKLTTAMEKVVALSRSVRRIQGELTQIEKSAFIAVTLLETMVLSETERLLSHVEHAGISCRHLVINRVMPETVCPVCAPIRMRQDGHLKTVRARFPNLSLTLVPLFVPAVQGREGLAKVVASL